MRVAVGDLGGAGAILHACVRSLRERRAEVLPIDLQAPSAQARQANQAQAGLFLGLLVMPSGSGRVLHFASGTFVSEGGRRLAQLLVSHLAEHLIDIDQEGRANPILRETRMPAVVVRLTPTELVVRDARKVAASIAEAIDEWARPSA